MLIHILACVFIYKLFAHLANIKGKKKSTYGLLGILIYVGSLLLGIGGLLLIVGIGLNKTDLLINNSFVFDLASIVFAIASCGIVYKVMKNKQPKKVNDLEDDMIIDTEEVKANSNVFDDIEFEDDL